MTKFHHNVLLILMAVICLTRTSYAQMLNKPYIAAYGKAEDPAIIFLHGGPGYNSFSFELSTAERLSQEGYYVIVYDQRGCGRSADAGGEYDFPEAIKDLDEVYNTYHIKKATLIGHSWGGTVGTMFAGQNPGKVNALVLVSAPVYYQQTFRSIINKCKEKYTAQNMQDQLGYIDMLEKMDTAALAYANYSFMHAMSAGLYTAKKPADNSKELYTKMFQSKDAAYLRDMKTEPVKGFYENERYTTLNLSDRLIALKSKVPVYGIYGTEDGLFDRLQLDMIKDITGEDRFKTVDNASHSVFIDQQDIFIGTLTGFIGKKP